MGNRERYGLTTIWALIVLHVRQNIEFEISLYIEWWEPLNSLLRKLDFFDSLHSASNRNVKSQKKGSIFLSMSVFGWSRISKWRATSCVLWRINLVCRLVDSIACRAVTYSSKFVKSFIRPKVICLPEKLCIFEKKSERAWKKSGVLDHQSLKGIKFMQIFQFWGIYY